MMKITPNPYRPKKFDVFRHRKAGYIVVVSTAGEYIYTINCFAARPADVKDVIYVNDMRLCLDAIYGIRSVHIGRFSQDTLIGNITDKRDRDLITNKVREALDIDRIYVPSIGSRSSRAICYGTMEFLCQNHTRGAKEVAKELGVSLSTVYVLRRYLSDNSNDIVKAMRYHYADRPVYLNGILSTEDKVRYTTEILGTVGVWGEIDYESTSKANLEAVYMFLFIAQTFGIEAAYDKFGLTLEEAHLMYKRLVVLYTI